MRRNGFGYIYRLTTAAERRANLEFLPSCADATAFFYQLGRILFRPAVRPSSRRPQGRADSPAQNGFQTDFCLLGRDLHPYCTQGKAENIQ